MKNPGLKILIVDDTALVVDRLVDLLAEMESEAEILRASSYDEGIVSITEDAPDILLLDIKMPGKNGIELLADVRQKHPDMIIIMLTNMVSGYYQDLCKEIGANYFVDKSKEFESIPGIIEKYLPV